MPDPLPAKQFISVHWRAGFPFQLIGTSSLSIVFFPHKTSLSAIPLPAFFHPSHPLSFSLVPSHPTSRNRRKGHDRTSSLARSESRVASQDDSGRIGDGDSPSKASGRVASHDDGSAAGLADTIGDEKSSSGGSVGENEEQEDVAEFDVGGGGG